MSTNLSAVQQDAQDFNVILPEPIIVKVPLPGGKFEQLHVMPIPFLKWREAFKLISVIAPALGFDINAIQNAESVEDAAETVNALVDKAKILDALQGEAGEQIIDFMALAINKKREYFADVYDAAIDIAVAAITVNVNFFCQRLLPKLAVGAKTVMVNTAATLQTMRSNG